MPAPVRFTDRLTDDQVDQLCAHYEREWWTGGRERDAVERMLAGSTEVVAGIDSDGRLVAFARALSDGAFRATIFDVIVDPGLRGSGLGIRLVEEILARPALAASRRVDLMCHEEMVPFYARLGFERSDPAVLRMERPRPGE